MKKAKKDRTTLMLSVTRKRLTGVDARLFEFEAGLRFIAMRIPRVGTAVIPWVQGRKKGTGQVLFYEPSTDPEAAVQQAIESVIDLSLKNHLKKKKKA